MHNSAISHEIVSGYLVRTMRNVVQANAARTERAHLSYFRPVHLSASALLELLVGLYYRSTHRLNVLHCRTLLYKCNTFLTFVSLPCVAAVLRCFINSTLLSLSFQSGVSFAHELRAFHPCRIHTCIHGSIRVAFISSTLHEIFRNFNGAVMRLDNHLYVIPSP